MPLNDHNDDPHSTAEAAALPAEMGQSPPRLKPILINVAQLQALLGCGRTTAFQLLRDGKLRSIQIGRSRRVLLADAERLVADALVRGNV